MSGLVAILLSGAILGSAFLNWIDIPVIYQVSLWDLVTADIGRTTDRVFEGDLHWTVWVFIASWIAAALSVLVNLAGFNRPVSLVTGALPLVAAGGALFTARDRTIELFGQVPGAAGQLWELAGVGFWVYLGAAAALVLVSLVAGR